MDSNDTLILVAYHKKSALISRAPFCPIHTGFSHNDTQWLKENMIGDDTGDNISDKNSTYNELTAIYWAYKNYEKLGSPKNIGLTHYRRFFIFERNKFAYFEEKEINEDFYEKIKVNNFNNDITNGYSFIAPMPNKRKSVYNNYCLAHHKEDIDLMLIIINQLFPQYSQNAKTYVNGKAVFFYNMFIFSKDMFFKYCEFIFGVLEKFESLTTYPNERLYISEVLTGIFITHLLNNGYRGLLLPVLYIGKKIGFKQAIVDVRKNIKNKKSSALYSIKPIIVSLVPNKMLLLRKRKTVSVENLYTLK